jgi:hypothetical protein
MDYQQKLPGAVFRMTGADYANLVAAYVPGGSGRAR